LYLPCIVHLDQGSSLGSAVGRAFATLGDGPRAILVIPHLWRPTVEIVPLIVEAAANRPALRVLVLVHPSAAMSFIASSVSIKLPKVTVRSAPAIEDAFDEGPSPLPIVSMTDREAVEGFIRRGTAELRDRSVRRGVLVLAAAANVGPSLGDVLVEELLQNATLRAIALVHPTANLDVPAASVRLRLPRARIVTAKDVEAAERALDALRG
jgi:hypothetical protein